MKKVLIADAPAATYVRACKGVGVETVTTTDLVPSIDEFDGLILPGGGDIDPVLFGEENNGSRTIDRRMDDVQLGLCDLFVKAGKPILGICKGCQVINVYFGGTIIQDLPDGLRERHCYHPDDSGEFHKTTIAPDSFLHKLYGDHVVTNSYHHQAIDAPGKGLQVIQWADDIEATDGKAPYNVKEAIVHETLPIIGLQWHPEKNIFDTALPGAADGEPLFRYFASLL